MPDCFYLKQIKRIGIKLLSRPQYALASYKFDYGGSASLNMCLNIVHLISRSIFA